MSQPASPTYMELDPSPRTTSYITYTQENIRRMAHMRLMTTWQGKSKLTDFIQAFELNAEQAGYDPNNDKERHHNFFLVRTLEIAINEDVRDQLYAGGDVPEDYISLRDKLIKISGIMEREKLRVAQQSRGRKFWTPARTVVPPMTQNKAGGMQFLAKKIGLGETAPMDRAQQNLRPLLCYNCGKEGHMKRKCPEPPKKRFNFQSFKIEDSTLREKDF